MKTLTKALSTIQTSATVAAMLIAFALQARAADTPEKIDSMFRQLATKVAPRGAETQPAETATTGTLSREEILARAREIGGEEGIREAAGLGEAPSVLDDPAQQRELLGENPRWIWRIDPNTARSDPMLIPWIAEKLLFEARDAEAKALEGLGKLAEALELYESLLVQVTDPEYRTLLEERIAGVKAQIEKQQALAAAQGISTQPSETPLIEPVLPQFILTETRGIIYDPAGGSFIAVGDQNLRVGDEVEGFPGVRVKSISYQTAVFSVTNESMTKDFVIQVQGDLVELQ